MPDAHPIVTPYRFSLVGKWHQNSCCTGQPVIQTADVFPLLLTIMDENGTLCRKCKGPARASE